MPAAFALGWVELLIVGGLCAGVLLTLGIVLVLALRNTRISHSNWAPPVPAGTPTQIRAIQPSDHPIAPSARWDGAELIVRAHEPATKALFDVPLSNLERCVITYRFQIQTDGNRTTVYPELWCRLPEKGQFFSRGVSNKIRGTKEWTTVEIPFYLADGQQADLLHLNLVFEQPGAVRIKEMEVLTAITKR